MKLTDEMIIEVCKKLVSGELESTNPSDCQLTLRMMDAAKTHEGMLRIIEQNSISSLIHANHHLIIDCIRAGWRLREEMQGCEELERMFKVK